MFQVNEGTLSRQADVLIGKSVRGWVDQINHTDFHTRMSNFNCCGGGGGGGGVGGWEPQREFFCVGGGGGGGVGGGGGGGGGVSALPTMQFSQK